MERSKHLFLFHPHTHTHTLFFLVILKLRETIDDILYSLSKPPSLTLSSSLHHIGEIKFITLIHTHRKRMSSVSSFGGLAFQWRSRHANYSNPHFNFLALLFHSNTKLTLTSSSSSSFPIRITSAFNEDDVVPTPKHAQVYYIY